MTAATHANDFAFDYTRGNAAEMPVAKRKPALLKRWFDRFVEGRQKAALAQIAMVDPRLAHQIRLAQGQSEVSETR